MRRIMLIEDDEDIRESLKDFLEIEGYTVSEANNGLNALNVLKSTQQLPQLILLDLMMPVMDGQTFRRHQLQDPKLSEIPVVVVSAATHTFAELELMNITHFLTKPVDLDEILETIKLYF